MTVRARAATFAFVVWGALAIRDIFGELEADQIQDMSSSQRQARDSSRAWRDWTGTDDEGDTVDAQLRHRQEQRHQGVRKDVEDKVTSESNGGNVEGRAKVIARNQLSPQGPRRDKFKQKSDSVASARSLQVPGSSVVPGGSTADEGSTEKQRVRRTSSSGVVGPTVRIHAVTFNAGNEPFKKDDDGWKQMVADSTKDAAGADIVFFGFQEFLDKEWQFDALAIDMLWKAEKLYEWKTFDERLTALVQEIKEVSKAPGELYGVKDKIIKYLEDNPDDTSFNFDDFQSLIQPVIRWVGESVPRVRNAYPNLNINAKRFHEWREQTLARVWVFLRNFEDMKKTIAEAAKEKNSEASGGGGFSRQGTRRQTLRHFSTRKVDVDTSSQPVQLTDAAMIEEIDKMLQELLDGITDDPPHIGMADVQALPSSARQHFHSGDSCHRWTHYDTVLFAYVNPYSAWKITPEPYSNDACMQNDKDGKGCTMDHSDMTHVEWDGIPKLKKGECAKVVMLLRFKATRGDGSEIRICVLNTHMSMRKTTKERLEFMKQAMDEAKAAECDLVVFVGDFNTRLRGKRSKMPDDGLIEQHPVMRSKEMYGRNTLQRVLDHFAVYPGPGNAVVQYRLDGGLGDMEGKSFDADEMYHMLMNEQATCWQGKGETEDMKLEVCPNPLFGSGLEELKTVPPFNPTYRLASEATKTKKEKKDKNKGKVLVEQVQDMKKCYLNPSGQAKNNPAWTDRVLLWYDPSKGSIKVEQYTSVELEKLDSDHMPVVGRVAFITGYVGDATFKFRRSRDHGGARYHRSNSKQRSSNSESSDTKLPKL